MPYFPKACLNLGSSELGYGISESMALIVFSSLGVVSLAIGVIKKSSSSILYWAAFCFILSSSSWDNCSVTDTGVSGIGAVAFVLMAVSSFIAVSCLITEGVSLVVI